MGLICFLSSQDTWRNSGTSDQSREITSVNRVDGGPSDHHKDMWFNCNLSDHGQRRFDRASAKINATHGFIEWTRFNVISVHHGEMRGCIMTVQLKIERWKLKKSVDLMTWDRVHYLRATWTHRELPILIKQMKDDAIGGSWDRGPQSSHNRSHRLVFTSSDGPRFSLTFSYKTVSSPF